jgi:alanyl-tRNA synthetase
MAGWVDRFKSSKQPTIAVAVGIISGKGTFMASASDAAIEKGLKLTPLVLDSAEAVGGRGGGKTNFARGSMPDVSFYDQFISEIRKRIKDAKV